MADSRLAIELFAAIHDGGPAEQIDQQIEALEVEDVRLFLRSVLALRDQNYVKAECCLVRLRASPLNSDGLCDLRLSTALQGQGCVVDAIRVVLEAMRRFGIDGVREDLIFQLATVCFEAGVPGLWSRCLEKFGFVPDALNGFSLGKYRYLQGLVLLFEGEYQQGWSLLESRYEAGFVSRRWLASQELRPENLERAQSVVLYAESGGLGDVIFSLRFVPLLREYVELISLVCNQNLSEFVGMTDLFDNVICGRDWRADPADRVCSILSLPHVLGLGGPSEQLLRPLSLRGSGWKGSSRFPSSDMPPLVAVNWQGDCGKENLGSAGIRGRSFPLACLESIKTLHQCRLISVQIGPGAGTIYASSLADCLVDEQELFNRLPHTLQKTAEILLKVDLLITNDTSIAHLGGILGVSTWVILNAHPYWQWGQQGCFSPWYSSVRCFRQVQSWQWQEAMAAVDSALRLWLEERVQGQPFMAHG